MPVSTVCGGVGGPVAGSVVGALARGLAGDVGVPLAPTPPVHLHFVGALPTLSLRRLFFPLVFPSPLPLPPLPCLPPPLPLFFPAFCKQSFPR